MLLLLSFFYVATSYDLVSHHVILLNHFFGPRMPQLVTMCSFDLIISRTNLFVLPFLLRKQLCVFLCSTIYHIQHMFCYMFLSSLWAVFRAAFTASAELIAVVVISSSPYPLFSSNLFSSFVLLFKQEAPGSTSDAL